MDNKLFQNDYITGNSLVGFEFKGQFNLDENILLEKLKDVLNRSVSYSNIDYKLLEPTDNNAVLIKDGSYYEVKTPLYSYFEAMFVLPKIFDLLKSLKSYKNSYLYFKIGFNKDVCDVSQINITKFVLEFNEDYVLKNISDLTKDGTLEKLISMKPKDIESCADDIIKQFTTLKFEDDGLYGVVFTSLNLGYITFKYAQDVNYNNKRTELVKCLNHTIITIYNACSHTDLTDTEKDKLASIDKKYKDSLSAFGCYDVFKEKYKKIKLTSDLNPDSAVINVIFPAIKDKLFDLVVKNEITEVEINYDADISKLQLKDLEIKNCHHFSGVDLVNCEFENCTFKNCDLYDTKVVNSSIIDCNLFGYSTYKECKLKDCFVSKNIQLNDCDVFGQLGKMGGTMKGGSLKDTSIIISMAELDDKVEKNNVNEIM